MPTYEYRCSDCSHEFEIIQRMTDDPLSKCPECGGTVKRLIGKGAGIIFKGSGFYQTDYRSDSYRQAAAKETSSDGGSSKSSSSSSESKSTNSSSSSTSTASSSSSD